MDKRSAIRSVVAALAKGLVCLVVVDWADWAVRNLRRFSLTYAAWDDSDSKLYHTADSKTSGVWVFTGP
jgi:hypothetical protein